MKIEVINDTNKFKELKYDWDDLLQSSNNMSIFLTWEWLYYWWIHFGEDKELFILLVKDESTGQMIGIAPFCIDKSKLLRLVPFKKIRFLGTEQVASDFLDFIIRPGIEDKVIEFIYKYLDKNSHMWDIIEITDVDEYSLSINPLIRNARGKYRILGLNARTCPYMHLPDSYELLLDSLSPNMRENLKRRTKQMENKNNVLLSIINKRESMNENIDRLFILHNARFNSKHNDNSRKSAFSGEKIRSFHYDIAENFITKDWLKFYFLTSGKEAIGCLYAFKYKSRLFYYQSGLNPDWHNWSPGTVLFGYVMKDGIKEGLEEFHFLRGNEEYKSRWTKKIKTSRGIMLIKKNFIHSIYYLFLICSKYMIKRFRRFF